LARGAVQLTGRQEQSQQPEHNLAKIFWDTNLFIYLFEYQRPYFAKVERVRRRMLARGDDLFTSAFTLGELLVQPLAVNRQDLVDKYRAFFRGPGIAVLPFDASVAPFYASIRQDRTISPADAIQLACAAAADIDLFITNDDRLSKKVITGIRFITSLDWAPL
jgi:uncharacterized protein